ncbi:MAG: 7-carboxy-7-deazaguanine synthase [Methylocystis sp.]|nr:7-carboxy-7-deazaguanine synthase [Methylocystis sp.]
MAYTVKEVFKTLQGEGRQAGRAAVFCRFAGCNLWSGREQDRAGAACAFCDTDFVGTDGENGGKFPDAQSLAALIVRLWGLERRRRLAVLTGGEPMLQVDAALIDALHGEGFEIAMETNGTLPVPASIDWICVSPKAGAPLAQTAGDELKLVFPQQGAEPERYEHLKCSGSSFSRRRMRSTTRNIPPAASTAICTGTLFACASPCAGRAPARSNGSWTLAN